MKYPFRHAAAFAALMLGAFASTANASAQNKPVPDPADANAPVPPTRYTPLTGAPLAATDTSSPAEHWAERNRVVASYDSMSLTMDMAEPKPAAPAAPAQPDPHSHHRHKEVK